MLQRSKRSCRIFCLPNNFHDNHYNTWGAILHVCTFAANFMVCIQVYHHSVKYLLHMWYISSQNECYLGWNACITSSCKNKSFSDENYNTKVQTLTQVLYPNNLHDVDQFLLFFHFGCLYFVIASLCEEGYRFDWDEQICTGKQDMHGECTWEWIHD